MVKVSDERFYFVLFIYLCTNVVTINVLLLLCIIVHQHTHFKISMNSSDVIESFWWEFNNLLQAKL